MRRKIAIVLINVSLGLSTAYFFVASARETKIVSSKDNIACEIIDLDLRQGYRHHPSGELVYQNKTYYVSLNVGDSLNIGFNNSTFFYDELLDRVFIRNSGIERGRYASLVIFILSFLLWLEPKKDVIKKRK